MRAVPLCLLAATLVTAAPLQAKPKYLAPAKALRADVKGCASCHTTMPPTKDGLQPMGLYLRNRKATEHATEVDVQWLKDYQPAP
jgi:hypothetical protein